MTLAVLAVGVALFAVAAVARTFLGLVTLVRSLVGGTILYAWAAMVDPGGEAS